MLQCDPKKTSNFSTICLNKSGNKKRTSRSFSILFSVMGSLEITVFVVLYLKLVRKKLTKWMKAHFSLASSLK